MRRLTSHDVVRHRLVGKIVDAVRALRRPRRRTSAHPGPQAEGQLKADEHRYRQRGGHRRRRGGAGHGRPVHARPDAHPPPGRTLRAARGRAHDDRLCTSGGWGSRGRPTCSPSPWTSCGRRTSAATAPIRTRAAIPGCSATWCCARRSRPNRRDKAGHSTQDELELLCVHGILHLLGYDHAEPEEHAAMFGTHDQLLKLWRDTKGRPGL